MNIQADTIEIIRQKVHSFVGVPEQERAISQPLWITVRMIPIHGFDQLLDDINRTVDYYVVSQEIEALAALRPRKLIETLAVEIGDMLLKRHPLRKIEVIVEKQILPQTDCVTVKLIRELPPHA